MARRDQRLYRDTEDTKIAGVCSGLGHYFDVDTTLVRVLFVVLALFGGGGLLGYLILWVVLDPAPPGQWGPPGVAADAAATATATEVPDVIDVTEPTNADPAGTTDG